MRFIITTFLFISCFIACSESKKVASTPIEVVPIHNYILNPSISLRDTINYFFISDSTEFHKMFYMTKTSRKTAIIPNFSSQSVVAILLKPTEKVVSINIHKAEIADSQLNIYYTITDTTSWTNYLQTPMAVATVAKSISVKQVNFYSNQHRVKTIKPVY